ncbi:methyltransferase [Roseofilum reptotaenium CS-1145]|nr:methyltransferase [Roseofilum reptotaenium]MDB9516907.1 methyltransferase [Roseofilum reptotaenium CS-1145]
MMTSATCVQIHKPHTDDQPLWDLILGYLPQRVLLLAHDLKLFPLLAQQPRSIAEICQSLNIESRPAFAMLSVLVSVGLVEEQAGNYSLTPLAEDYLLASSSTYVGGVLDSMIANDTVVFSFESLKRAVLTNSPQFQGFETFEQQMDLARLFTRSMHSHSMAAALAWPKAIDLSGYKQLLDIGGGSGTHSITAILKWSALKAIVLDLQPVCEVAKEFIAQYGLENRIQTHSSNMWEEQFPVADCHFYADIYHDWTPEKGRFLTQKSFDSLPSGGRLIIHEMLYNDSKFGPQTVANYNFTMLVTMQGQQYSGRELSTLLSEVGFVDVEVIPTTGYWSIVTGCKP